MRCEAKLKRPPAPKYAYVKQLQARCLFSDLDMAALVGNGLQSVCTLPARTSQLFATCFASKISGVVVVVVVVEVVVVVVVAVVVAVAVAMAVAVVVVAVADRCCCV